MERRFKYRYTCVYIYIYTFLAPLIYIHIYSTLFIGLDQGVTFTYVITTLSRRKCLLLFIDRHTFLCYLFLNLLYFRYSLKCCILAKNWTDIYNNTKEITTGVPSTTEIATNGPRRNSEL